MPWTAKQMRSIRARAHGWSGPGAFENVSEAEAKTMEGEGIKGQAAKRKRVMDKIVKRRRRKGM